MLLSAQLVISSFPRIHIETVHNRMGILSTQSKSFERLSVPTRKQQSKPGIFFAFQNETDIFEVLPELRLSVGIPIHEFVPFPVLRHRTDVIPFDDVERLDGAHPRQLGKWKSLRRCHVVKPRDQIVDEYHFRSGLQCPT